LSELFDRIKLLPGFCVPSCGKPSHSLQKKIVLIFLIYGTRDCLDFFRAKERNDGRNLIFLGIFFSSKVEKQRLSLDFSQDLYSVRQVIKTLHTMKIASYKWPKKIAWPDPTNHILDTNAPKLIMTPLNAHQIPYFFGNDPIKCARIKSLIFLVMCGGF
jgi:hypothetical protein